MNQELNPDLVRAFDQFDQAAKSICHAQPGQMTAAADRLEAARAQFYGLFMGHVTGRACAAPSIEELKQQNADLRMALQQALQSLEYIESAYPQVAGKAKRVEDIRRGQALLDTSKNACDEQGRKSSAENEHNIR